MPVTTEYTADGKGAIQRGMGIVTGAEIIEELRLQHSDPTRPQGHEYVLVDFSAAEAITGSMSDIAKIVAEQRVLARLAPDVVIAIVAPSDLAFGLARMWEGMAHGLGWDGVVVRSRAEGLAWLREKRASVALV